MTTTPDRSDYLAQWRRTPARIAYLFVSLPISVVVMAVLWSIFATGLGLAVVVAGLPIMVLALLIARGTGGFDRLLLKGTGLPPIAEPQWPARPTGSWWRRIRARLTSPHHWSYLAHQALVGPLLTMVTFTLSVTCWASAVGGLSYPLWGRFLPDREPDSDWPAWLAANFAPLAGWTSRAVESGVYLTAGVVFAVTLPWTIGALTRLHHAIAAGMLGRWPSDDLAVEAAQAHQRAVEAGAAREAAVHAEDNDLRRLERDLHDGPQQRLIRLQMDLASAERRALSGEPEAAVEMTRQAQVQAQAALEELRALSRGVAPPLLADRGLRSALAALAEDSPLTARVELDPELDRNVSPEVARAVYFVVAELCTNAAKHSGASQLEISADVRPGDPSVLKVVIADNGRGGARLIPGHGLAGLTERMSGLLGTLTVESPTGGPTRVEVTVPVGQRVASWPSYPQP